MAWGVLALAALPARADDAPVIPVPDGRVEPRSLSVHIGELVRPYSRWCLHRTYRDAKAALEKR